jgi:hypothetical protein
MIERAQIVPLQATGSRKWASDGPLTKQRTPEQQLRFPRSIKREFRNNKQALLDKTVPKLRRLRRVSERVEKGRGVLHRLYFSSHQATVVRSATVPLRVVEVLLMDFVQFGM